VDADDVLVQDTAGNSLFALTSVAGVLGPIAISNETIVNSAIGNVVMRGFHNVKVQGAVSIGQALRTSTTSKRAEAMASYGPGAFGIAFESAAGPGAGVIKAYLFGKTQQQNGSKGVDVASINALILGTSSSYYHITGTTTITSITQSSIPGSVLILEFDSTVQLTSSASLLLAGGSSVVTSAGQVFVFVYEGSSVWREVTRSGATGIINRDLTSTSLSTGTAETTLYTFSLLGGILGDNGLLHSLFRFNNVDFADGETLTLRLKYGATTLLTFVLAMAGGASVDRVIDIEAWILATATNAQQASGHIFISTDTNLSVSRVVHGTGAIDSTIAQDIVLTAQFSVGTTVGVTLLTAHTIKI